MLEGELEIGVRIARRGDLAQALVARSPCIPAIAVNNSHPRVRNLTLVWDEEFSHYSTKSEDIRDGPYIKTANKWILSTRMARELD